MPPETTAPHASRILTATLIGVCALCALVYFGLDTLRTASATQPTSTVTDLFTTSSEDADSLPGTALVPFEQTKITLAPGIAQKFSPMKLLISEMCKRSSGWFFLRRT